MTDKQAVETMRWWVMTYRRFHATVGVFFDSGQSIYVRFAWGRRLRSGWLYFDAAARAKTLGKAVQDAWRNAMNHPTHPGRRMRKA